MKTEHMIVVRYVSPTGEFSRTFKAAEGGNTEVNVEVPPGAKDYRVDVALPVSKKQGEPTTRMLMLDAEFAATVRANDPAKPTDSVELAAASPRPWCEGGPFTAMFGSSVTALFVTDNSPKKTGGMFRVRALVKT